MKVTGEGGACGWFWQTEAQRGGLHRQEAGSGQVRRGGGANRSFLLTRLTTLKSDSDAISSSSSLVAQDADMRTCCGVGGAKSA